MMVNYLICGMGTIDLTHQKKVKTDLRHHSVIGAVSQYEASLG